jgi:methionine-R-sulfoxide reductase
MNNSDPPPQRPERSSVVLALITISIVVAGFVFLTHGQGQKPSPSPKSAVDAELRTRLTPLQYYVTRQSGTEPAFQNEYWNNHRAGIYVDVISGDALFTSLDKYESGTGWPSFYAPREGAVETSQDRSFFTVRTEVHCSRCGGHLGHVFDDGPRPTGLRYCLNGVAMNFEPDAK